MRVTRRDAGYLARFVGSGVAAVTCDFGIFLLLRSMGVALLLANSLAFAAAFATGFLLNRHWTFRATEAPAAGQVYRYAAVAALALVLSSLVLYCLVSIGMAEPAGKGCAIACSALVNFLLSRAWVFRAVG